MDKYTVHSRHKKYFVYTDETWELLCACRNVSCGVIWPQGKFFFSVFKKSSILFAILFCWDSLMFLLLLIIYLFFCLKLLYNFFCYVLLLLLRSDGYCFFCAFFFVFFFFDLWRLSALVLFWVAWLWWWWR